MAYLRGSTGENVRLTVDHVRERTFVVGRLIDQARAMQAGLDHQGLLIQIAAQNELLALHVHRLGPIQGLELPDLGLEQNLQILLEDFEGGASLDPSSRATAAPLLEGFEDCAERGDCR